MERPPRHGDGDGREVGIQFLITHISFGFWKSISFLLSGKVISDDQCEGVEKLVYSFVSICEIICKMAINGGSKEIKCGDGYRK